jgi:radical SAM protein with 4Fe4S-binding SPASM domain
MIDLVHVDINLTNACNLACTHCHSSSGTALNNELSTEEIVRVVHQLYDHGVLSITFAGGEPFMHPGLLTVLKAACRLDGWQIAVVTNGLFLTESVITELLECPGLTVNVSIDGSTPTTFSELRGQPGSTPNAQAALFRRVTGGVRRAVERGLRVSVNTTMTRATMYDLVPTYRLAVGELGAEAQVAIKFFPAGYGRQHLERYEFPWPVWAAEFQALTKMKMAGDLPRMELSLPSAWEFYLPVIAADIDIAAAEAAWRNRSPLREPRFARSRSIGDVAGVNELCISSDGSVYPSVLMVGNPAMLCGSVRQDTVASIWLTSPRLASLRDLSVSTLDANCSGCGLVSLCGGGSRSRAVSAADEIAAADAACPLVKPAAAPREAS